MASPNTLKLAAELKALRNKPVRWVWQHPLKFKGTPYKRGMTQ